MISSVTDPLSSLREALTANGRPTQENPSATFFGELYAMNSSQFATTETAETLAQYLGGTVVDLAPQWGGGAISAMPQIQFGSVSLNAGLLAERFLKYDTQTALRMTEDEVGYSLALPAGPAEVPADHLTEASEQFEGLMLGQMLKAATPEPEDGPLAAGDSASSPLRELAQESMARAIAAHGGLGLAETIVGQLRPALDRRTSGL